MAKPDLSNYVDVPTRIKQFRELYPEGTLQQVDLQFIDLGGSSYVCYTAAAFRSPSDERPGMGTAWEPVPGPTPYTKDSEVQNAETSAWGRAIIAVGAGDASKIASREEVRNRTGEDDNAERTPLQRLLTTLASSGFTPQVGREIIGAALEKLVPKVSELDDEECELAIRAVEVAMVDRDEMTKSYE